MVVTNNLRLRKNWKKLSGHTLAVMKVCGGKCFYCGIKLVNRAVTVDHFIPKSLGGSSDLSNKVAACGPCNWNKSNRMPTPDEVKKLEYLLSFNKK
jgi:5-methylcytosine-specific restriction endonuclease McrA